MAKKSFGWMNGVYAQVWPTWGRVPVEQIVVFCGVEVHDDSSTIKKLFVTAGTGDAVVAVSAVASVKQLLRLHLATLHPKKTATQTDRVKSCGSPNCQSKQHFLILDRCSKICSKYSNIPKYSISVLIWINLMMGVCVFGDTYWY